MKYLFIDTSTHDLTIAISSLDEIFSIKESNNTNEHSKYALLSIKECFDKAGLKPNEIDKIIVVNGPGSFTGVRIGVTIAKTYAWSLKKDVVPISSLLANALSYDGYDYYITAIDARRGHVYAAIYNDKYEVVLDEQYISIEQLSEHIAKLDANYVVIGDIKIGDNDNKQLKINVLKIVDYCHLKESVNPHSLKPRYLKLVEAEEKLLEGSQS